jgi:predicted kinase
VEAVIFIGVQASGKSTFFRERFSDSHVRINLDMLRTRHREARLLQACLETQQPFVADNTNPDVEDRRRYIEPAKAAGFRVTGYYFQSKIEDLINRNLSRPHGERIPEAGILGTYSRLVIPKLSEGFDDLHYVRMVAGGGFEVLEWKDEV